MYQMMILGLLWCFTVTLNSVRSYDTEVVVLRAVRGREARLPCGQGRLFLDGPDAYVLWLKNDRDLLYRFPNEETERRIDKMYDSGCNGDTCHDETALLLKRVSEQDGGIYRCKVHYQASPSIDYVIDVRLVDSPGTPRIYNENGDEIKKGYVGPFSLGSDLTLVCEVDDEQPDTLVYWRRNGLVIERAHAARPGVLRAQALVRNMTRGELDAHYECLAQNADVTEPLSASVVVKMYLPPISVEIRLNNNRDFEAGLPRVVDCVVVGCVPPPSITWHLGEAALRPTVHKELHDGNYTVSSLTLAPSLRDSGHRLSCRAHNSHLPEELYEDSVQVNVGYRPMCISSREETVGAVAGQAESVSCEVEAAPEPLQVSWTFPDDRTLYTSLKRVPGHHNRYSSTLTWLPREEDIGTLLCRATNSFGEQKRACSYSIARGGPPLAPECVLLRSYPNTVKVQCKKGWDGGRPQTVHLELMNSSGFLVHNVSDPRGQFQLSDVDDGGNFSALVYASNSRGRSAVDALHLHTVTPLVAHAVLEPRHNNVPTGLAAGVSVAIILATILGSLLIIMAVRMRRLRDDNNPDLVPRTDGSFHREPDFAREERVLGTTNITVNQLAACQNQYSSSPVPSCRVVVGCGPACPPPPPPPPHPPCLSSQHSYFV